LMQLTLKSAVLCEMTRNNGHTTVQGHSRSLMLVTIESPCVTSY